MHQYLISIALNCIMLFIVSFDASPEVGCPYWIPSLSGMLLFINRMLYHTVCTLTDHLHVFLYRFQSKYQAENFTLKFMQVN